MSIVNDPTQWRSFKWWIFVFELLNQSRREKNDIECQYRQNWLTPCSHHERWLQNENEARCNKHIIRIPNRVFGANSSPVSWKEGFFYSCISLTFPMTCAPCYQMICFKNPFRFLWEKERIKIVLLQNLPHFLWKKAFYIRVSQWHATWPAVKD